jgi:hypothetical protein
MRVSLTCGQDEVTILFPPEASTAREVALEELSGVWLLLDERGQARGLRLAGLRTRCPYELEKVARANAGTEVLADLATIAGDCERGPVYYVRLYATDRRVTEVSAAEYGARVVVTEDGWVVGLELFERDRPLEVGLERPTGPRGVLGRRTLLVGVALVLGVWVAVAVVGSTGVWGAIWVGGLAALFSAAVLFCVEVAVLNRM